MTFKELDEAKVKPRQRIRYVLKDIDREIKNVKANTLPIKNIASDAKTFNLDRINPILELCDLMIDRAKDSSDEQSATRIKNIKTNILKYATVLSDTTKSYLKAEDGENKDTLMTRYKKLKGKIENLNKVLKEDFPKLYKSVTGEEDETSTEDEESTDKKQDKQKSKYKEYSSLQKAKDDGAEVEDNIIRIKGTFKWDQSKYDGKDPMSGWVPAEA